MPRLAASMKSRISKKAFTLIELLMVLVIMSLITIVFLDQQNKFDSSTLMRALAYDVALSVRQAQVYGISVQQSTTTVNAITKQFASSYGIEFDASAQNSYFIFADPNYATDNGLYDTGTFDSLLKTYTISNQYVIQEFCEYGTSPTRWTCNGSDSTSPNITNGHLSITFQRPNPDATFHGFTSAGALVTGSSYSAAYIQLEALNTSDVRVLKITNTGVVTVCSVGNISGSGTGVTIGRLKSAAASC